MIFSQRNGMLSVSIHLKNSLSLFIFVFLIRVNLWLDCLPVHEKVTSICAWSSALHLN